MDFSSQNPTTTNSLNLAARNNDVVNVRRLLKKKNPNLVDNRGWTCLHEAASSDSFESLQLILNHQECRPLSETHEGHTALYLACRNVCSIKTISYLLENVKDIANYSSTEGVTPLHLVSGQGRVEVMQLLLDHGAIIDVQDFDGDTPLHEACLYKHPEAIKLLLHAGAKPQVRNEQSFTPFHVACCGPDLEAVKNMRCFIDDVNQATYTGVTSLMLTMHAKNDEIVYYLLEQGADPNLKNQDGKTALDAALEIGYSSIFKYLFSVIDKDVISLDIVFQACKPHLLSLEILGELLSSDLGPQFFEHRENISEMYIETIDEFKPIYEMSAPLNSFLHICEYIYLLSQERFKEYFYLFLMRGVEVNALVPTEFPPLVALQYFNHEHSFHEVFDILLKHGCNVDYCSTGDKCPAITDAFVASLCRDPRTLTLMLPYSLYCDPGSLIKVAERNGVLERLSLQVQDSLLQMIDKDCSTTTVTYLTCFVPSLKHITRLKLRDMIKAKDGVLKSTQQFLEILNGLPVPKLIKDYLRFL